MIVTSSARRALGRLLLMPPIPITDDCSWTRGGDVQRGAAKPLTVTPFQITAGDTYSKV